MVLKPHCHIIRWIAVTLTPAFSGLQFFQLFIICWAEASGEHMICDLLGGVLHNYGAFYFWEISNFLPQHHNFRINRGRHSHLGLCFLKVFPVLCIFFSCMRIHRLNLWSYIVLLICKKYNRFVTAVSENVSNIWNLTVSIKCMSCIFSKILMLN